MEFEGDPDLEMQVPAVSAGSFRNKSRKNKKKKQKRRPTNGNRTKKMKYRDMVINAIRATGELKGSNFNKITRFVEKKYRMKNDFIIKHTLKWLIGKRILTRGGGRYRLQSPLLPSAGKRKKKRRASSSAGVGGAPKRRGKKGKRRRKKGKSGGKKRKGKGGKKRKAGGGKRKRKGKKKARKGSQSAAA